MMQLSPAIAICFVGILCSLSPSLHAVRLQSMQSFTKKLLCSTFVSTNLFFGASLLDHPLANAFGPKNFELKVSSYKQVELCNGKKPIMPGQKAALGLFPICIEVTADIVNTDVTALVKDASVYGFVKEDAAGNSVLPNNPDFKSDAGQYAMIATIKPGDTQVSYQFVAAVSADPKSEPLPKLSFQFTKAVSFPGGEKFKPLDECEIDPRAPGCEGTEDD